jgi:hypothetical protein
VKRTAKLVVGALALVAAGAGAAVASRRPSNDRDWSGDQARLPSARFDGSVVHVRNVRNFDYQAVDRWTPRWEDRRYDLDSLSSVWFVVEPFSSLRGPAHTFVSFGFGDSSFVAVSVEVRKERGEQFDPVRGMLREYELMYVVADERDAVRLRSNFRRDSVVLYRAQTTPQKARQLFVGMMERANALAERPEFYNTLTSTCTTNIVRHVNAIAPKRIPRSYKVLLPGFADELAYDLGLLDRTRPFAETRRLALINPRALAHDGDPRFSLAIRGAAR